jgi:hypothetical protein
MKKSFWITLTLMFILAALPLSAQARSLHSGNKPFWRADYYDNPCLCGYPVFSISEDSISHNWGMDSPALSVPPDHFSARWTSTRFFEKGTHMFVLTVDDGARVWFDGKLILDAWDIGHKLRLKAKVYVDTSGDYEIQVAYFDNTGPASVVLESLQLGSPTDIVSSWKGEYFVNCHLCGDPVLTRRDPFIDFDWSTGSPDPKVTRDNFSVRWTRQDYLLDGIYTVAVRHDDGMRIFIDGKILYDAWYDQPAVNKFFEVRLPEGFHTFIVAYYDHVGDAVAQVRICGPNLC